MLFAASHPERTSALIFCGGEVKEVIEEDWPWGQSTRGEYDQQMDRILAGELPWGEPAPVFFAPSRARDPLLMEWLGRLERSSASAAPAAAFMLMGSEIDVRHVAPSIHVPTLVMHSPRDSVVPFEQGRWLAKAIPGARFVELSGQDHRAVVRHRGRGDRRDSGVPHRVPGTDPAGASARDCALYRHRRLDHRARELGDSRWRELLEQHHSAVRNILVAYRGNEIDNAGDGFLASFDGPARAIRCALAVLDALDRLGIPARSGLHTGECEVVGDKLAGIAVHIGARVAALADPGEVFVSQTVRDLVAGSGIEFDDRGLHELKGLDEPRRLFTVRRGST